jgi:peptidoglycan/LPS O-acetylase OafA/YrhL
VSERIDSVQVLRAIAAVAVVAAHTYVWVATASANANIPNPVPGMVVGAAGVDLFFVISRRASGLKALSSLSI